MFQVPFSFLNLSNSSFNSNASVLASWGLSRVDDNTAAGSIVGLEDGSILLLRRSEIPDKRNTLKLLPPAALSHASLATTASRSTSPSGSHSPFPVTSRSRIVSGITTEQVEAPKNYVDFDDEPEKLEGYAQGSGSKG
ncbi:hypothetical protein BT96DRAFT_982935 [Gymnopus androsaceus JB14]|uniref:Uncharacterized protein n=1 Tax=Gymnopus androsaceus JB14 TaxID=1447944 RepID=A0A6A4IMY7_9AGAR|nr:hypothetical protein BT96DRAFT_982935 [Gymnopus androsaceus JB14]